MGQGTKVDNYPVVAGTVYVLYVIMQNDLANENIESMAKLTWYDESQTSSPPEIETAANPPGAMVAAEPAATEGQLLNNHFRMLSCRLILGWSTNRKICSTTFVQKQTLAMMSLESDVVEVLDYIYLNSIRDYE